MKNKTDKTEQLGKYEVSDEEENNDSLELLVIVDLEEINQQLSSSPKAIMVSPEPFSFYAYHILNTSVRIGENSHADDGETELIIFHKNKSERGKTLKLLNQILA